LPVSTFTLRPAGPYSLRESAIFGFGQRDEPDFDGVMRLAFCLDGGFETPVGVELHQHGLAVEGVVQGVDASRVPEVSAQVARVLSLDHDATGFEGVAERDPVVAALMKVAPGLRPPLFYSPYEAAAWAIISARRPVRQMSQLRARLSAEHGRVFELAGQQLAAFPSPSAIASLDAYPGLQAEKILRLHGVAEAAQDGRLEAARLLEMGPEAAAAELQQLRGVGPFYSALITIRACGFTDVLPIGEQHLLGLVGELYGLGRSATDDELADIAESWRPWRTWVSVLIRAAAHRVAGPRRRE